MPAPVFVAHEHTWSYEGQPLRRLLDRQLIARRADAFVAVSEDDRRKMIEIERIPPEKSCVHPQRDPRPAARHASPADLRAELGIGAGAPVVGMVATLRPQKAYDVLIAAAARLRRDGPRASRVVIAGGEESEHDPRSATASRR